MISAEELAYREHLLEDTRRWAEIQMPALFRSVHHQRLQPMLQTVAAPPTPLPEPPVQLPDTGSIPRLRETAMIPALRLFKPAIEIRNTSSLVSQAAQRFFTQHGCLPTRCLLNPLRVLTIEQSPTFYLLGDGCAEIVCYTISIGSADDLASDAVRLLARDQAGEVIREDYAL